MVSNFRNLESHRRPILHLFRHLLRISSVIEHKKETAFIFKQRKGIQSSYKAREWIQEAFEWDEILREYALDGSHKEKVNEKLEKIHSHMNPVKKIQKKEGEKNQGHKKEKDRFIDYNTQLNELKLEELKNEHALQTYRKRILKHEQQMFNLTSKRDIDNEYIDLIKTPDYRTKQELAKLNNMFKRDVRSPNVKLQYMTTPLGFFWYLKRPDKPPSDTVGGMIRSLKQDRSLEQRRELEQLLNAAKDEALWESITNNKDIKITEKEWTKEIMNDIKRIDKRRKDIETKLEKNRDTLIQQMTLLNQAYQGRRERRYQRWQSTDPPSSSMYKFTRY